MNDVPIFVGFGHIVPKIINGAKKYKVEFFPKIKLKPFIADAKTKSDSLEFTTPSVEATIFENGSRGCAASGSAALRIKVNPANLRIIPISNAI